VTDAECRYRIMSLEIRLEDLTATLLHAQAERVAAEARVSELEAEAADLLNRLEISGALRQEAEARENDLEAALRLMLDMYDRHSGWCGYNKNAPGDHIHNTATRAARTALADDRTEEGEP
jgi:hypothetical protein